MLNSDNMNRFYRTPRKVFKNKNQIDPFVLYVLKHILKNNFQKQEPNKPFCFLCFKKLFLRTVFKNRNQRDINPSHVSFLFFSKNNYLFWRKISFII